MLHRAVPMIHVPDVSATADWYAALGFTIEQTATDNGDVVWALVTLGESQVMLNAGGNSSRADRREVDLYIHADDIDGLFARIGNRIDVVEGPHDTFYGMREFIVRDLNRFWITFGQVSVAPVD